MYDFKDILVPKMPSRKNELQRFLTERQVDYEQNATVAVLKEYARDYIVFQRKSSKCKKELLHSGPVSSLLVEDDLLFVAAVDNSVPTIKQCHLLMELDKVKIESMRTFVLPDSSIPVSMALYGQRLFFTDIANKGGLHSIELESTKINQMINDGTDHKLYGIFINSEGKIFVSCTRNRRLYVVNVKENDVCLLEPFCGSDKPGKTYGLANSVSFVQPTAMAVDGKSVVVIDTAKNSVT